MTYKKSIILNVIFVLCVALGPTLLSSCKSEKSLGFKDIGRPSIVFITAEDEYSSVQTLPVFAKELEDKYNFDCKVLYASEKKSEGIIGLEALEQANLVVLYVRRRALPVRQMQLLRKYLDSTKPLIGLRTASHAFDTRGRAPKGCVEWKSFDHDVLGGNYHNHHREKTEITVTSAADTENHPILKGIKTPFKSKDWLYMTSPLAESTNLLLVGSIPGQEPEPIAWTNRYKGARIFYTSLGNPSDFNNEDFRKLLINAVFWALEKPVP